MALQLVGIIIILQKSCTVKNEMTKVHAWSKNSNAKYAYISVITIMVTNGEEYFWVQILYKAGITNTVLGK